LFIQGPFEKGTNNIGEFLALVHGLGYLKQRKLTYPIYSDSNYVTAAIGDGGNDISMLQVKENTKNYVLPMLKNGVILE